MSKRVLGSKFGSTSDAAWRAVLADPRAFVSDGELQDAVGTALERLDDCKTMFGPTFATAWSGGKDSLVVFDLCHQAGSDAGVYSAPHPELEYPWFLDWLAKHKPANVEVVFNGLDMAWLRAHPIALWPDRHPKQRTQIHTMWNRAKWRIQKRYFADRGLDFLVFGRRTIDGNFCGPAGAGGIVTSARTGYVGVNVIHDWSHELVIAYIVDRGIQLPPAYDAPGGFKHGVRCWALDSRDAMRESDPKLHARWSDEIDRMLAASP